MQEIGVHIKLGSLLVFAFHVATVAFILMTVSDYRDAKDKNDVGEIHEGYVDFIEIAAWIHVGVWALGVVYWFWAMRKDGGSGRN